MHEHITICFPCEFPLMVVLKCCQIMKAYMSFQPLGTYYRYYQMLLKSRNELIYVNCLKLHAHVKVRSLLGKNI